MIPPSFAPAASRFRALMDAAVRPHADTWDREEALPLEIFTWLAQQGLLGLALPSVWGGGGADAITLGALHEEAGAACSSVRCALTVHAMVSQALLRWGSPAQRQRWLPSLARGEALAAFALSEPAVGSDAAGIQTRAEAVPGGYALTGVKRWITLGECATHFLLFARLDDRPTAFWVPADSPGLARQPLRGLLGCRASRTAELHLSLCFVPEDALIGRPGLGVSLVASAALDHGRYTVAWGCVGLARAACDSALRYAHSRQAFGAPLVTQPLVQQKLTDMAAGLRAARLLCLDAGARRDRGEPSALAATAMAKYVASVSATRAADAALQLHGANGIGADYPAQRLARDARVMEIIEGSTQIHQMGIGAGLQPEDLLE